MLTGSRAPLGQAHDLVMFDLDGVVYVGGAGVEGAAAAIAALREEGRHVAFVTNNASRPPGHVADRLTSLGVPATAADVVTSAQAAARVVLDRHGPDARVLVLGGAGLQDAMTDLDLTVTLPPDPGDPWPEVDVVASGYGPDVRWRDVMLAATLVRDGIPYVASNTDGTIPTPQGVQPGHGVLVATISRFAGVRPEVAGKPAPPLLEETIRRVGGDHPLMVGDRLDTDIAGGIAVGVPTLLVMTGVTGAAELVAADPAERPSHVAADLSALAQPHGVPLVEDGSTRLGGWEGRVTRSGELVLTGAGDLHDWWRVVAVAGWTHRDTHGTPPDVAALTVPLAADGVARR